MLRKSIHNLALSAIILLFTVSLCPDLFGQQLEVDSGEVTFFGSTQIENFSGVTEDVTGSLNLETGEFNFKVDLRSLDTGNSRRDRNMHEDYLETDEYPYAEFTGSLASIPDFDNGEEHEVKAQGTFLLKEISRDIEVTGSLTYDGNEGFWRIKAGFTTLLSDYDISRPRVLIVRMRDEVELDVNLVLRQKQD
ncbi:MAG: YceI family protein [Balneolia bacterium]|nr:YceI family protein [Balneolia bacterium]